MIVPDVNVLITAHDPDADQHEICRLWWGTMLSGTEPVGLAWATILGFIRISTNPRACLNPLGVSEALQLARAWLAMPCVEIIEPGPRHAEIVFGLLEKIGVAGNLTSDAHLAALAIECRAEVATTDNDFRKFAGLKWFNPARVN
jgi:toxin-antitoxin system PIN domain toxin